MAWQVGIPSIYLFRLLVFFSIITFLSLCGNLTDTVNYFQNTSIEKITPRTNSMQCNKIRHYIFDCSYPYQWIIELIKCGYGLDNF